METIEPMSIALYGDLREPVLTYGQISCKNGGQTGDNFSLLNLNLIIKSNFATATSSII